MHSGEDQTGTPTPGPGHPRTQSAPERSILREPLIRYENTPNGRLQTPTCRGWQGSGGAPQILLEGGRVGKSTSGGAHVLANSHQLTPYFAVRIMPLVKRVPIACQPA